MTFHNYYQTVTPPCRGIYHVFLWTATYTNIEPPDGTPCVCGAVKYAHQKKYCPHLQAEFDYICAGCGETVKAKEETE